MHTGTSASRLITFVLAAVLLTSTALACGGHRGGHRRQADPVCYDLCPVEDCETAGRHTHDGVTYCGYPHASGSCSGICVRLCTVEDCQIVGRHLHDGVICCGYDHEDCFCDGTCVSALSGAAHGCHQHRGGHC